MSEKSLQLFFSYSHKDEDLRNELANHLSSLTRQGVISNWHDRKILPGQEWDRQINDNLNTADIILLLISSDFIASDYCWGVEVTRAIERHYKGEACVIPVILRRVDWQGMPFAKLQALPKNAEPVTSSSWSNIDDAFNNVAQGIKFTVERLKEKQASKENVMAEYRHKVEEFAADGEISLVESDILQDLQKKLGLSDQEARTVRDEVLKPYGERKENLDKYKQFFTKFVDEQGYPLEEKDKAELKKLQQYLNLKDEDIALIDKEAKSQKQRIEIPQQQQEAQRLQLEKEQEIQKLQQQEVERLQLQSELEETQRRRQEQQFITNDLRSDPSVNYTRLRDLLEYRQWKEADEETLKILLSLVNKQIDQLFLKEEDINGLLNQYATRKLMIIDNLWAKYSNKRFGFNTQKQIYLRVVENFDAFSYSVGWRKQTGIFGGLFNWKSYEELNFQLSASEGHLPFLVHRDTITSSMGSRLGTLSDKLLLLCLKNINF